MDIKIQSLKFDASKQLIEFIEKKMSRLERFAENPTGVDVVLRLEKDDEKGNKVALVTLHVAGGDILTEQRARTFEEAIDNALDVVKRQIEKRKDK
ncbi:MAG: ribosome-associated translation inhibitor RaiA [Alistipes sp.]|nr:ribosome-associated translation inhibitor RaiA [Alistipes sp.]MBP3497020.1 ribosome-associated translation inhibitor RaiA [Alistipes sp.]MBQ3209284.1 ribosome-associated translation inhibitor RaiA [Alistipes sp.]MBQ6869707.1 ribosome-associated translation inhibitor RaiA [Alistipes sp.]MBQ7952167.1 ribosome-associated translation inhibitor RaiA [Alistipes sp.]